MLSMVTAEFAAMVETKGKIEDVIVVEIQVNTDNANMNNVTEPTKFMKHCTEKFNKSTWA